MATATMTSKGQLTVPKSIREFLELEQGDTVELQPEEGGRVVLRKRRNLKIEDLFGILPNNGVSLTLEEMDEAIGDYLVEKYRRARG